MTYNNIFYIIFNVFYCVLCCVGMANEQTQYLVVSNTVVHKPLLAATYRQENEGSVNDCNEIQSY